MRFGWFGLAGFAALTYANVEKTIFSGPAELSMTSTGPTLDSLCLHSLTPAQNETRVRLSLPVSFPTKEQNHGQASWYLLQKLQAGQRYEVRICWSATQPTDFHLSTYGVEDVFDNPALLSDLSTYSEKRQALCQPQSPVSKASVLFLKIEAAADFVSSDPDRMRNPPNVLVDIILDPFLFNVLPQSLLWTGLYIVVLIPLAFVFSGFVWRYLFGNISDKSKVT